jgi:hypothetical protein
MRHAVVAAGIFSRPMPYEQDFHYEIAVRRETGKE